MERNGGSNPSCGQPRVFTHGWLNYLQRFFRNYDQQYQIGEQRAADEYQAEYKKQPYERSVNAEILRQTSTNPANLPVDPGTIKFLWVVVHHILLINYLYILRNGQQKVASYVILPLESGTIKYPVESPG
jgi:hypothetical protein